MEVAKLTKKTAKPKAAARVLHTGATGCLYTAGPGKLRPPSTAAVNQHTDEHGIKQCLPEKPEEGIGNAILT